MKVINYTPSTGVTITNPQDQYFDAFSDYLSSIFNHWEKNNIGCKLTLSSKLPTDTNGKTAELKTENCPTQLRDLVSTAWSAKNITKELISGTEQHIKIAWVKEGPPSNTPGATTSSEKVTLGDKGSTDEAKLKADIEAKVYSTLASQVASSSGNTTTTTTAKVKTESILNNKILQEQIIRMKQIMKL